MTNLDPRFVALGPHVFMIQRYDRLADGTRVHQEDFAQVRGVLPERKYGKASYEGLARIVGALCGHDGLLDFMRRVLFAILSGNDDAHLKNWSLLYPDGRTPRLAPVYDQISVREFFRRGELAFPLAKERSPTRIGWEHLTRIERYLHDHGLPVPLVAPMRTFVTRCLDHWQQHRLHTGPTYRTKLDRITRISAHHAHDGSTIPPTER
ncbi:type II toxin-antitoxin system HipA family toxin [Chondromyces crocatus]|uniref:type II toxin-antitoxin system HipA family toxin n=1 Tax=Chondromyces crocatus TaxID=52 RepID=UPI0007C68983|nr:HipA domain-containing protein [Chondromyces crocatus]